MAKRWYPVIDILSCLECGTCVAKCTHGVYDKEKAPVPVVVNSDGCIDHCHGCGNICPVGAIAYVGDDTGWIAPALSSQGAAESDCGCCGDIAGVQVDCRVFEQDGKFYEVPTKEMLADGILRTAYQPAACSCGEYQLPENLKRFFEGKEKKAASSCCCGGNCC